MHKYPRKWVWIEAPLATPNFASHVIVKAPREQFLKPSTPWWCGPWTEVGVIDVEKILYLKQIKKDLEQENEALRALISQKI